MNGRAIGRAKAVANRGVAAKLNREWGVGAVEVHFNEDGHWYKRLTRFPAALFDPNGYIVFPTEREYLTTPGLSVKKQTYVAEPGISQLRGYVRMVQGGVSSSAARVLVAAPGADSGRGRRREADQTLWKVVVHHDDPDGAMDWISSTGRVAVGWGSIGDLREVRPSTPEAIGALIHAAYPRITNSHIGGPSLWSLFAEMAVGDLVILVARRRRVQVAEVTGDYLWASEQDSFGDYQHQRPVVLTDLDADDLWRECGGAARGQAVRWVVCRCAKPARSRTAPGGDGTLSEGSRYEVLATRQERNEEARRRCMAHHGLTCAVCGMDFQRRYGTLGEGFIHVHHIVQFADAKAKRKVDPIRDLRPVCPNCHAMIHRERPPIAIERLREQLRGE